MSQMLKEKRATRGQRMGALIGEAADQDASFWGAEIWGEDDSGNESFSEESDKPDEFDSDFNDSEDDDDEEESEEEEERERGPANKYKDPSAGRKPAARPAKKKRSDCDDDDDDEDDDDDNDDDEEDDDEDGGKRKSKSSKKREPKPSSPSSAAKAKGEGDVNGESDAGSISGTGERLPKQPKKQRLGNQVDQSVILSSSILSDRAVRESTKTKSTGAELARQHAAAIAQRTKPRPNLASLRHQFTQRELLEDALLTEAESTAWLDKQKQSDDQRARDDKPIKAKRTEGCIRHLSRRGSYATITFADTEKIPPIFSLQPSVPHAPRLCVITGLPARYFDPVTQQPYANIDAFRTLRAPLGQGGGVVTSVGGARLSPRSGIGMGAGIGMEIGAGAGAGASGRKILR